MPDHFYTGRDAQPEFARSARPSPYGKRTSLVRARISEASSARLNAMWRALGYANQSEFVSELLEVHVNGPDHVLKVHEDRIRGLVGIDPQKSIN